MSYVESKRGWSNLDVVRLVVISALHLLCVFAPFTFSWNAFWIAFGLYNITGLFGITLSFHRNLSHGSFKLPKWLEYTFAYCGLHALQGDPISWVRTHRYHHQYTDTDKDPHTPTQGLWFGHMGWLFDTKTFFEKCGDGNNVRDLEKQAFYKFLENTYNIHHILLGALLFVLGGFPYVVWGVGVRIVCLYHTTGLVNSVCHTWGDQPWNTANQSRNNWWAAGLTFGEGWHNNHHAFEYSARHGLEWWQIDVTWYVIKLLQIIGLATNIKLPAPKHMQRMAFPN